MRFDVYGRFQLEVLRDDGTRVAYKLGLGKRIKLNGIIFPDDLKSDGILFIWMSSTIKWLARRGMYVLFPEIKATRRR
jgi:hypothetical protein